MKLEVYFSSRRTSLGVQDWYFRELGTRSFFIEVCLLHTDACCIDGDILLLQDSNLLNLPELGVFLLNGVQHRTEEESKRYDSVASEFHIFWRQSHMPWTTSRVMERILSKVHQLKGASPGCWTGRFSTPCISNSLSLVVRFHQLFCSSC